MNSLKKSRLAHLVGILGLTLLLFACGPQINPTDTPTPSPMSTCIPGKEKFYSDTSGVLGQQSADADRIANNIYNQHSNNLSLAKDSDTDYWKEFGRFVWAKLTYDYFSLR
jgi:hypothetical protein